MHPSEGRGLSNELEHAWTQEIKADANDRWLGDESERGSTVKQQGV